MPHGKQEIAGHLTGNTGVGDKAYQPYLRRDLDSGKPQLGRVLEAVRSGSGVVGPLIRLQDVLPWYTNSAAALGACAGS